MRLLFLLALVVVAAILQQYAKERCLDTLEVALRLSKARVEPGEEFELILTLENKGRFFLPFLRYWIRMPEGADIHLDSSHIRTRRALQSQGEEKLYITGTTWLGPRQRLEKHIPLALPRRGYYTFHDLTIFGGDFLGLKEQARTFNAFREIVVYPESAPQRELAPVFGGFLGEMSVRRFIQEDPVLTLGYREYSGREPMKTISWTQSARRGQLIVKQFDYTLEPSASVILNTQCQAPDRDVRLEQCFSLARSVCAQLEQKGIKYDFCMNVLTGGGARVSDHFSEGLGTGHYYGILEYLGRATYITRRTCRAMLERAGESMRSGSGIIFITPEPDPDIDACARRFALRVGGTLLILTARGEDGTC